MARRKRTRDELEEARRENESVNATPAEPEEHTTKRRRQARRSTKRRNITKALEAMSVDEGDVTMATVIGDATTIPFFLPVAAAVPILPPVSVVVAATTCPEDDAQERRRRDAERQRRRRAAISASQKERDRAKNAERARVRRARLNTPVARARDAERMRAERARLLEVRTDEDMERERLRRAGLRSSMTDAQMDASQESARVRQQHTRASRTEEDVAAARERDRLRTQLMRANRTAEEQDADRERARVRRRCLQKGLALCNQENFSASMVTGPHVVDGRHRLPETTVCEHCNAWKWPAESKKGCCIEGAVQLPPLAPAPPLLLNLLKDPEFRRKIRAYNQAFAFTSIGASCNARGIRASQPGRKRGRSTGRIHLSDPGCHGPLPRFFASIYRSTDPASDGRQVCTDLHRRS